MQTNNTDWEGHVSFTNQNVRLLEMTADSNNINYNDVLYVSSNTVIYRYNTTNNPQSEYHLLAEFSVNHQELWYGNISYMQVSYECNGTQFTADNITLGSASDYVEESDSPRQTLDMMLFIFIWVIIVAYFALLFLERRMRKEEIFTETDMIEELDFDKIDRSKVDDTNENGHNNRLVEEEKEYAIDTGRLDTNPGNLNTHRQMI